MRERGHIVTSVVWKGLFALDVSTLHPENKIFVTCLDLDATPCTHDGGSLISIIACNIYLTKPIFV